MFLCCIVFLCYIVFFVLYCVKKLMCAAAALQSSGRRRQVLTRIRAKRELTAVVKTEPDSEETSSQELSEECRGGSSIESTSSRQSVTIGAADEKSLLAECVLLLFRLEKYLDPDPQLHNPKSMIYDLLHWLSMHYAYKMSSV